MVCESLIFGGLVGVASSFVASKVFLSYTNSKLPVILTSDCLVVDTNENGDKYLVVKILNKTKHPILDTKVELFGVTYQNEDHSVSTLDSLSSNTIHSIREYSPHNKERPDAIWLGLKVTDEILKKLNNYDNIRIEITTRESFYNTFLSLDKTLSIDKICDGYIFEKGDDMTCRKIR